MVSTQCGHLVVPRRRVEWECMEEEQRGTGARVVDGGVGVRHGGAVG